MYFDGGSYGAIFVWSTLTNCYLASVNPEFGTTSGSESCLCRATVEPITIKFGTAEARRLNWAYSPLTFIRFNKKSQQSSLKTVELFLQQWHIPENYEFLTISGWKKMWKNTMTNSSTHTGDLLCIPLCCCFLFECDKNWLVACESFVKSRPSFGSSIVWKVQKL